MKKRERYGDWIGNGKACILVKEPGLGDAKHPFWQWLFDEGFHLWLAHGNYGCDWVFINLNSMVCAPGMPGISITEVIRHHAVTAEEFKVIWGIFTQYEGLSVLKMPEKPAAIPLPQDVDGMFTVREATRAEMDRWLLTGELPPEKPPAADPARKESPPNGYFVNAPSDNCRAMIVLEQMYHRYGTERVLRLIEEAETALTAEDWIYLHKWHIDSLRPEENEPPQAPLEERPEGSNRACCPKEADSGKMDTERGDDGMASVEDKIRMMKEIREEHPERYLPLVSSAWKVFPAKDMGTEWYDDPQYNLGWDVGILEGNRPYFMECWASCGITMLTYFVSTEGIEDARDRDLAGMLTGAGLLRFLDPEHNHTSAMKFTDENGNEFFSINIKVGDEEGTYVDGGVSYPYKALNALNRKSKKEKEGRS